MSAEQTDPALADTAEIDDVLANEDDLVIEAVPADELEDEEEEEQDFQSVLANIKKAKDAPRVMPSSPSSASSKQPVVEDFFRNFLLTNSLTKTLEAFQIEWHELQQTKKLRSDANEPVPDVYARNQQLEEQTNNLKAELAKMTAIAQKAKDSWDRFKQERDVHRMHHRRVVQEKNKLITDIKRLQAHYSKYEPTLRGLRKKYEDTSKEKMLVTIERDRLTNKVEALERQLYGPKDAERPKDTAEQKKQTKPGDTPFPPERRVNPNLEMVFDALPVENFRLQKTFKGHPLAVSGVTFHPKKPVVATTSDDRTWKLWSVPNGDLIMSGDGHRDWVSSCDFHPDGAILATASGDSTVKLWDFKATACVATYTDHTQAVWDVAFHDLGDFLASGSMDHTAKLWDIHTGRCRQTFRGHVDSVNALAFQPFSNILCTGSGDKTLSLWDIRSGMCVQTFYGHHNAVNSVCFNSKGDAIASCDSDGVAKLWDVRMVSETAHIATANIRVPLNDVSFDRSGKRLMMASEAGVIKVYSVDEGRVLTELAGHEDAIQGLALDPLTGFLASVGSDGTLRLWSQ